MENLKDNTYKHTHSNYTVLAGIERGKTNLLLQPKFNTYYLTFEKTTLDSSVSQILIEFQLPLCTGNEM